MGMILRIASSRIVGQGDIVGRSGYFSLNLSANSVMRGRLDARRTLKSLVADLRLTETRSKSVAFPVLHVVFHPGVLPGMAASGCGHIRSVLSYTLPLFLKISLYVFTNPVDCVREAGFFPTSDSLIFFFHICPHRLLTDSPL